MAIHLSRLRLLNNWLKAKIRAKEKHRSLTVHDLISEDSFDNDPTGLRATAWAQSKNERTSIPNNNIFLSSSSTMMSHELKTMLFTYKTQLLSPEDATVALKDVTGRHTWGGQLNRNIK